MRVCHLSRDLARAARDWQNGRRGPLRTIRNTIPPSPGCGPRGQRRRRPVKRSENKPSTPLGKLCLLSHGPALYHLDQSFCRLSKPRVAKPTLDTGNRGVSRLWEGGVGAGGMKGLWRWFDCGGGGEKKSYSIKHLFFTFLPSSGLTRLRKA